MSQIKLQSLLLILNLKIKYVVLLLLSTAVLSSLCWKYIFQRQKETDKNSEEPIICYRDFQKQEAVFCKQLCKPGYYNLPMMPTCAKHLSCKEIYSTDFQRLKLIGGGSVKAVSWFQLSGLCYPKIMYENTCIGVYSRLLQIFLCKFKIS